MEPREGYYSILGPKVVENLNRRGFDARYITTSREALDAVRTMIPEGSMISWGGTMSLEETGIKDFLNSGRFNVLDRAEAQTPETIRDIYHKALSCDYYFMSTNALTSDGVMVNIDGNGNRLAALVYGPEHIVVVAGMNKVVPDEQTALLRVQNTAAPINAQRLGRQTPCLVTGSCSDCLSPDCMCSHIVYTRRSHPNGRIKIILVGEELGY